MFQNFLGSKVACSNPSSYPFLHTTLNGVYSPVQRTEGQQGLNKFQAHIRLLHYFKGYFFKYLFLFLHVCATAKIIRPPYFIPLCSSLYYLPYLFHYSYSSINIFWTVSLYSVISTSLILYTHYFHNSDEATYNVVLFINTYFEGLPVSFIPPIHKNSPIVYSYIPIACVSAELFFYPTGGIWG